MFVYRSGNLSTSQGTAHCIDSSDFVFMVGRVLFEPEVWTHASGNVYVLCGNSQWLATDMSYNTAFKTLIFPCPGCGHRNRFSKNNLSSLKLYLRDWLPPCRNCGRELRKENFAPPRVSAKMMSRAQKELEQEGSVPFFRTSARQKQSAKRRFIVDVNGQTKVDYK
jgi:hypothetical protein